jgi:hypothetical protein
MYFATFLSICHRFFTIFSQKDIIRLSYLEKWGGQILCLSKYCHRRKIVENYIIYIDQKKEKFLFGHFSYEKIVEKL